MDNLNHSVVGLGIGALIDRSVPPEATPDAQRVRARMLLTVGCLASNFPDLDLVLTKLLEAPLDRVELAKARLPYEELDQLTMEVLMGVR